MEEKWASDKVVYAIELAMEEATEADDDGAYNSLALVREDRIRTVMGDDW